MISGSYFTGMYEPSYASYASYAGYACSGVYIPQQVKQNRKFKDYCVYCAVAFSDQKEVKCSCCGAPREFIKNRKEGEYDTII